MDQELDKLEPQPKEWLSTDIKYIGQGRATFMDPKGVVWGPCEVTFDEIGSCTVVMDIEGFEVDEAADFGGREFNLLWLINGGKLRDKAGTLFFGIGFKAQNTCTSLEVTTSDGVFKVLDEDISYPPPFFKPSPLRFYPTKAQFIAETNAVPLYWVIPLSNYISNVPQLLLNKTLANHPLRLNSNIVLDPLNEISNANLDQVGHLVAFEFNESQGFIEPLPDFVESKQKLLNGRKQSIVTAIMVGEIRENTTSYQHLDEWLPLEYLDLLSLASGTKVGAPWIEFRTVNGTLTERIHKYKGQFPFYKGRGAIEEDFHRSTGLLLTKAAKSPYFRNRRLHVATRLVVSSGNHRLNMEDILPYLFRALDTLCKENHCYKTFDLKQLDPNTLKILQQTIDSATNSLNARLAEVLAEKSQYDAEILRRIISRVEHLQENVRTGFWEAVLNLMKQFNLADIDVMNRYYGNEKQWPSLIQDYRGRTIHDGYINYSKHDPNEIVNLIHHLHDVLLRIILKMFDFDGRYQPAVMPYRAEETLDWVQSDTPATRLGYPSPEAIA